jgi:N-formylglutamate amidohydrolase
MQPAGAAPPNRCPLPGDPQAVHVVTGRPWPSWVVAASPHSGRHYPPSLLAASRLDLRALRQTEDAFLDQLLEGVPDTGSTLVTTDFARSWLDLNRNADELDPLLIAGLPRQPGTPSLRVQAGLGVVPRTAGESGNIYHGRLAREDVAARIETVHRPYHAALDAALDDAHARHGRALLLDCHSMPSGAGERPGIDVILGDRFGVTCFRPVMQAVSEVFTDAGLVVARNAPFAGGYATVRHGRPAEGRQALQIEIARSLYMNEATLVPHAGFARMQRLMVAVFEAAQRA